MRVFLVSALSLSLVCLVPAFLMLLSLLSFGSSLLSVLSRLCLFSSLFFISVASLWSLVEDHPLQPYLTITLTLTLTLTLTITLTLTLTLP